MAQISRRDFVKTGGTTATAAFLSQVPLVHAAGQEQTISVGLIGCGGRGTGAAENCLESSENVRLTAMGDMFPDRLAGSRRNLSKREGFKVTDDHVFSGFDAYKRVLDSGVDMVILATPPGFRPMHFKAAVEAGKHIFFEKPVAVDPAGVRMVMEFGKKAEEKKLGVVAGTQRRHQKSYVETIQKIHEGGIGDVVAGRCYWNGGGVWVNPRREGQSDMEYQLRNWYYYTWLSGDHIVEQHIHNIDVMNWVLKGHPKRALAVGGRQSRTDAKFGHIYDHFGVDFEYANDVHVLSMCRHWNGTPGNVSEAIVGTKGKSSGSNGLYDHGGKQLWKPEGGGKNAYVQEHTDLIASIRAGKPLNEAQQVAESTLAAIMGREAAYTGQILEWDKFLASDLNLLPENLSMDAKLPEPPVAIPGKKA
jgi:predicted dehydrogenase